MADLFMMLPVGLLCVIVAAVVGKRIGGTIGRLLPFGAAARVVGGVARHHVNEVFYNGSGDSKRYFAYGATHSSDVWTLDLGFLVSDDVRWWGTRFIENVSAFVIALTGENILSGFVAFAMFSLAGVTLLALAFRSVRGPSEEKLFASLLLLWPSLCFWPSSMGKDAVMLLGIGLTVFGYVGRGERVAVGALVGGFVILTCIRPHVAAIVAGGMVAAELLRARGDARMSWFRRLSLVSIGIAGGATALSQFGLDITDVEGIEETFDRYSGQTSTGGSMIAASSGSAAVAMALVNSLMRPFPWEAHHVFALFASVEIWALWGYLWARRKTFGPVLRKWRSDRLLRVGVPVGLLLAFFYGLAMSNLGIIARQRVVILPFLFVLIAVSPPRSDPADEARP